MNTQKANKFLFLGLASLSFLPRTAAAIGQDTGIEASLVRFANNILLFQVSSAADVLLFFIAPIAGFYFIQKNMLSFGFEMFEERIDRSSYGRRDEDIPNGIKGLSIVTAFITVQMLGMLGAGILLATGLISIVLGVIMQLGLLEGLGGGGSSSSSNSSRSRSSSSNNTQPQQSSSSSGGSSTDWGSIIEGTGNAINALSSGSGSSFGKSEEDKIKNAFSVFDHGDDVPNLFNTANSNLNAFKSDVEDAIQDRATSTSRDELEFIENRSADAVSRLKEAKKKMKNDKNNGVTTFDSSSDLYTYLNNQQGRDDSIFNLLKKIEHHMERIDKNEKIQDTDFQDDIDDMWDIMQLTLKVSLFIERLPYNPREILSDTSKEQKIYNNSPGHISWGGSSYNFLNELSTWENNKSTYSELFRKLEDLLEKDMQLEKRELKGVKEDLKEYGLWAKASATPKTIPWYLEQIKEGLDSNVYNSGSTSTWINEIEDMETLTANIRQEVERLRKEAKGGKAFESETYEKVKKVHKHLS